MYTIEDAIEDMREIICFGCNEYKGLTTCDDEDCGMTYCIFCQDECDHI